MNNENEAMVEVSYNRNTVRQKMKTFSQKGLQMGLMNKENFPQRRMEKAWDSDV